jgi:hypothetical protein
MASETAQKLFHLRPDALVTEVPFAAIGALFRRAHDEARPVRPEGYDAAIQVFDGREQFYLPQAVPILDEERQLAGVTPP